MSLMIPDLRSRLSSIGEEDEDAAEEDGGEDRELSSGEVLEGFEFEPGKSVTRKSLDSILSSWGARELRNLRMDRLEPRESQGLLIRCFRRYFVHHSVQDVWFPRAWFALWVVVQLLTGALLLFGQFVLWSGPNYDVLEANATLNFSLGSTVLVNGLLTLWFTIIPSDKKLWILVGTSSITIVSYAVLSFVTENDLILFERLYSLYVEAVTIMTSNDPRLAAFENILVGSDESTPPPIFPPNSWIALEMAKASGAFLGMISAKVVLASLLWLIFEMKFQPAMPVQEMIEDDDDEEEADSNRDMIRRCEFAETTLPVSLILFAFALVNYLSLMYYSAVTVVDIDTLLFMTRLRFLLTSCLLLVAFLLLNLRFKPTESKELRVILGAMAVMVIGVWYTIVLREVNVAADELNKRVVLQPGRGNETCFRKCFLPMDTGITFADRNSSSAQEEEDGGNLDCSRVCIANERICDNTIDLINPLTNLTSGGSYTFLPLLLPPPGNRTKEVQLPLLFPDELYCLSRALPAFSINYLITCICFFLAIALLYYTLPLLSFFWRRSRRRVQKSRARVDRGGAADPGGPYGSLGES